jgi:hypothetical protein
MSHPAEPEVWVVVASNDGAEPNDGPIVFEVYVNTATRENAQRHAAALEKRYGPCRIARLVFDIDHHSRNSQ